MWDLSAARCVDWLRFESPVVSLSMSRNAEFLATAHVGEVGVFLWTNTTLVKSGSGAGAFLDSEPRRPAQMDMPLPDVFGKKEERKSNGDEEDEEGEEEEGGGRGKADASQGAEEEDISAAGPRPKSSTVVTFSELPRARWKPLAHLDRIKQRNKPTEAPKAPKSAPFFLPTVGGVNPVFAPQAGDDDDEAKGQGKQQQQQQQPRSRILRSGVSIPRSKLTTLLRAADDAVADGASVRHGEILLRADAAVLAHLKSLAPSAVDVEFRALVIGPGECKVWLCVTLLYIYIYYISTHTKTPAAIVTTEDYEGMDSVRAFLDFLRRLLATKTNFELAEAYLDLVLKLHGEAVTENEELARVAAEIRAVHAETWGKLQEHVQGNLCLLKYFSRLQ